MIAFHAGALARRAAILYVMLAFAMPALADTLVDNVDGLTLDAEGNVERFNGLLVGDDGRVAQLLKRSDKRPGKVDYLVDGRGRVLMPGLIDSHVRLMPLGLSRIAPAQPAANGKPRPEDRDLALAEAQQALFAAGITAVSDIGTTIEDWQTYRRAGDLGTLRLRVMAYAGGIDDMLLIAGPGPTPWLYDDRLRLNGLALSFDGPLATRAALLKAPYTDAPTAKVAARLNETQLKNLMSRAAMDNFQVALDTSGDKAVATALGAIAELSQTYKGERRWRLERVEAVDPADLPRLRTAGLVVSMQPGEVINGPALEAKLGVTRMAGAYAWKSLADAGASLAFGSGLATQAPAPFAGIAAAITRQDAAGQPYGGWQGQERLTREAALAAYTTGAAFAGFADGRFGRLARGQRADFVLVDRDPLLATPAELRAIRVLQTWAGGRLVYQAKEAAPAAADAR